METTPVLLDSSIIIEFFRKKNKSRSVLYRLVDRHELYISAITAFEIEIGLSSGEQRRDYDILTKNIEVLVIDDQCIKKAVEIYQELKRKNAFIGLADLLIAATARSNALPLATLNQKHFKRVLELTLLNLPK